MLHNIAQPDFEAILEKRIRGHPLVDFRRGWTWRSSEEVRCLVAISFESDLIVCTLVDTGRVNALSHRNSGKYVHKGESPDTVESHRRVRRRGQCGEGVLGHIDGCGAQW